MYKSFPLLILIATLLSGCASNLSSNVTPGVNLKAYKNFYVEKLPPDNRGINDVIVKEMAKLGIQATTGPAAGRPQNTDVRVKYEDRWMWDITMYLLSLKIDLRDASNDVLLATGQASYTSLVRKTPEYMANEILESIFHGKPPDQK